MNGRKSITPRTAERLFRMADDLDVIAARLKAEHMMASADDLREAASAIRSAAQALRDDLKSRT